MAAMFVNRSGRNEHLYRGPPIDVFYQVSVHLAKQFQRRRILTEPVSLTFHSALRKLNTEPPIGASHQDLVIWLSGYREEDI